MTFKTLPASAAALLIITLSTQARADEYFQPFELDIDLPKLILGTVGTTFVTGMGLGVSGLQLSLAGDRLPEGAVAAGLVSAAANAAMAAYLLLDDCSNDSCSLSYSMAVINLSTAAMNVLTSFIMYGLEPARGTAQLTPVLSYDGRTTEVGLAWAW